VSSVLHSCKVKMQICITHPQCVKIYKKCQNWTYVQENCHLMSLSFIKNFLTGILLHRVKYVMLNFAVIVQWFSSSHNVWKIIMGTTIFYFYFLSCASFFLSLPPSSCLLFIHPFSLLFITERTAKVLPIWFTFLRYVVQIPLLPQLFWLTFSLSSIVLHKSCWIINF